MRNFLKTCALLLGSMQLFATMPALAETDSAAGKSVTIIVHPDAENIRVVVELSEPVTRFELVDADVVREKRIVPQTPALQYANNAFLSDEPISSFSFLLTPDPSEHDAKYRSYYAIGGGRLVYAPTFYPMDESWDYTVEFEDMPDGWTVWPNKPQPNGYIFMGPERMITQQGGTRFVTDGNFAPEGETALRDSVVQAMAYLTDTFGSAPEEPPFIASSFQPGDHISHRGSVTGDAMVVLRFSGRQPDPNDPASLATTRGLILHEGVHFWNGGVAHFAEDTPQWLHEGGAEYLASLGSYQLGWTSRSDLQESIGQWLDRCQTSLSYSDEAALNDLSFIPSSIRYSCGPMLQFLAELYLAENRSSPTVKQGWRKTVQHAVAENDGEYDVPAFLAALNSPNLLDQPALAAILATKGKERWSVVEEEMQRLGVGFLKQTSPHLRARTALMHLIRSQCTKMERGQGYGFYLRDDYYPLDTPEGCGLLAGNPNVVSLSGHPITGLTAEDYADVQTRCAAGELIAFGLKDGGEIMVPCPTPLPDPATQPEITKLPDIPALRLPQSGMKEPD